MDECIKSTNASDADVEVLGSHQVPETRESKCLTACVQQKLGAVCSCFNLIPYHSKLVEIIQATLLFYFILKKLAKEWKDCSRCIKK